MINLPEEFKQDMKDLLKEEFDSFISSYNEKPLKGLRINLLKIDKSFKLPFAIEPIPWCKEGYYYSDEDTPGKHVYHDMGLYYIQEPSAMSVAEELDVKEGEFILDLCASPGGKSTQIGVKLNGTGLLVSNEIIPSRAKVLSSNIERMGIKNAIVLNETPASIAKHFKCFFDKILVDAPCSGEGMFRKNEQAIDEWSEENVQMCAERQLEILIEAQKCLKEKGRIVFSTCTFSNKENEGVVKKFLELYPEFHLVESNYKFEKGVDGLELCQRIYPHKVKGEGHFFAILERDGKYQENNLKLKVLKKDKDFEKFVKDTMNVDLEYNLLFGTNLYLSPYTKLDGLKVLRAGLHLGEIKKNRFEPSHSLCMALKAKDFKNVINLDKDSDALHKYMQGETIPTEIRGWGIICVDNNPVGLFKGDGNQAKNHYPKGLRYFN